MDLEWNKTIQENVKVNGAVSSTVCFPTGSVCVQSGEINCKNECPQLGKNCPATQCPCPNNPAYPIKSTEQVLTLMNIYQSEWAHYDDIVWKHAFTHFGFILAVILFPFVTPWLRIPAIAEMPYFLWVFPVVGIVLAFVLLLIMLRYAVRMRCCSTKYRDLIEMLPKEYQEERLSKSGRFSITVVVAVIMFILLVAVAVFVMFHIPKWLEIIANSQSCLQG